MDLSEFLWIYVPFELGYLLLLFNVLVSFKFSNQGPPKWCRVVFIILSALFLLKLSVYYGEVLTPSNIGWTELKYLFVLTLFVWPLLEIGSQKNKNNWKLSLPVWAFGFSAYWGLGGAFWGLSIEPSPLLIFIIPFGLAIIIAHYFWRLRPKDEAVT